MPKMHFRLFMAAVRIGRATAPDLEVRSAGMDQICGRGPGVGLDADRTKLLTALVMPVANVGFFIPDWYRPGTVE